MSGRTFKTVTHSSWSGRVRIHRPSNAAYLCVCELWSLSVCDWCHISHCYDPHGAARRGGRRTRTRTRTVHWYEIRTRPPRRHPLSTDQQQLSTVVSLSVCILHRESMVIPNKSMFSEQRKYPFWGSPFPEHRKVVNDNWVAERQSGVIHKFWFFVLAMPADEKHIEFSVKVDLPLLVLSEMDLIQIAIN